MTPKLCPVVLCLGALCGQPHGLLGAEKAPAIARAEAPRDVDAHFKLQPRDGSVEFLAVGWPGALSIHGRGARPEGIVFVDGRNVSGAMTLDLTSLDTGIGLRNRHMKDNYLEVSKYPRSELLLKRLAIPEWPAGDAFDANDAIFEGELSLHGTTRPVRGTARIRGKAAVVEVAAAFEINTHDFGIETPGYMGITVAETIKVKVHFSSPLVPVETSAR